MKFKAGKYLFDRIPSLSLLTILVLGFLWYLVAETGFVASIFLPHPTDTIKSLWDLIASGTFARALGISFSRIAIATVLATVAGSILGVLMGISLRIHDLLSPITQPLRYVPITALLPILILWFGIGELMKIIFLFTGIVFYFTPLVSNAVEKVPRGYIDVARSFGASQWKIVRSIYWPNALPQIFDGLIVINGIGWTYVILAEIVNSRNGLGYLINVAGRLQHTDDVFAGLILIGVVAVASDRILRYLKNSFFFW